MGAIRQELIGDTITFTWISSGAAPSPITAAVFTGSQTIISSESMISSGNGHFYSQYLTSDTPGFYVVEMKAFIGSNPFKRRVPFQVVLKEVD